MEKKFNKIIPEIPVKRPPEQRKRLSLSYLTETKQNSNLISSHDVSITSYIDLNVQRLSIQDHQTTAISHRNSNSQIVDEFNSFLNESHYLLADEYENDDGDDDNNHAYCYLSQTTNSIIIEEPTRKASKPIPKLPEKRFKFNTSTLVSERQVLMKEYNLESFRQVIYQRGQNHLCADCQCQDEMPRWISCLYFITLCDLCAEIHRKLPHKQNKYYLIEINRLYHELSNNQIEGLDIVTFLNIFCQTGNEKFNSLIEVQIDRATRESALDTNSININNTEKLELFIKNKYLNKCLTVSDFDLDFKSNYLNELNEEVLKIIKTPSVSITIFFIYLGANINYTDPFTNKTLLDVSQDFNQMLQFHYLKLNKAVSFFSLTENVLNHQFEGSIMQVYDLTKINKLQVNFRIDSSKLYLSSYNQLIDIDSVIRVFTINNKSNLIELKWLNKINNSLISSYFEYKSHQERQIWMKELCYKLILNLSNQRRMIKINNNILNLLNLIDTLQIKAFGYLDLQNTNNDTEKILLILLTSLPIQINFNKKYLSIIKLNSNDTYSNELIDIKSITNMKKTDDSIELFLSGSKTLVFKSIGYTLNLKPWHEQLESLIERNNLTNKFKQNISHKDIKHL